MLIANTSFSIKDSLCLRMLVPIAEHFIMAFIVLALGEEADFEALNFLPALNLIRSTKFHLSTESAFLPNAYLRFVLHCPHYCYFSKSRFTGSLLGIIASLSFPVIATLLSTTSNFMSSNQICPVPTSKEP